MDSNYNYDQYAQKAYSANVFKVDESEFIIEKRYKPTQQLGSGAYGIVIGCEDTKATIPEQKMVAIKKIERTFEHRFYAKRTLRELKILRNLKHENIVNLITIQLPKSRKNFYDIYCVTELLDTDLKRVIDKEHAKLNQDHFKLFLYQILRALKYMHSANILHRDLKPTNLLLNKQDCMLKVCDFGLSRALLQTTKTQQQNPNIMTDYVETRYYRAPELLLGLKTYTQAVDIWSVGCIFAEIVRGKTLWRGQNSKQQIKMIFETLGTPSKTKIMQVQDTFVSQKLVELIQELGALEKVPWDRVVKGLPPEGYDLLEKLLEIDYKKRITAAEALKHPYLKELHNPSDEPTRVPVSNMEFEFEMYEFTNEQLKDMIYEEILLYHYPDFKKSYEEKIANNQSIISHIMKGESAKIIDPEADDDYPI
ncbi:unnamed protein product [Paramecium primaurelia]|uniref:Protein kinase domain-containing protein n=2 Tax=Paramecium TaxID=5884 RepID=A0A8S1XII1_9CILI|nr:unnamed protein product [Paramecium primaurelia]CAD8200933.1 unnamed protein product [Paramecium pentaurelia]